MKRWKTRTAAGLLAAVLICPPPVSAMSAQRAILMDAGTGRVLYEKKADERSLIASTTKIMTALVICEECNVLDRVKIPKEAVGIEGSSMYLREGEVLTVQELLYGLMLQSGNDAAVALAIYCGGTVEGFAERMNDRARALGMTGTHFANPNGLDHPEHYSTPRDMGILAAYAMENPIFARTVGTKSVRVGERYLTNHNKLLWQVAGADGIKTGYTRAAGRILVSSAQREGRRLVAVTMNDPDDWRDHAALLEEGFSRYRQKQLLTAGQNLGECAVFGGETATVSRIAAVDFSYALAEDEVPQVVLSGPGYVYAPVSQGAGAGFAYLLLEGRCVGKVPLVYGATVEQKQDPKRHFWQRSRLPGQTVCSGGLSAGWKTAQTGGENSADSRTFCINS